MTKVDNSRLVELLSEFSAYLKNMDVSREQEEALDVTEELLNTVKNPKTNDFILTEKGSKFLQKITLLRGGFGSNKLFLDADSKKIFESIQSELPKERTNISTLFARWG